MVDGVEAKHRLKKASTATKRSKKAYEESFRNEKDLIRKVYENTNMSLRDIAIACGRHKAHIHQIIKDPKR